MSDEHSRSTSEPAPRCARRSREAAGRNPRNRAATTARRASSTSVLEGGDGPPLLLLHGPGAYGASWQSVIPELATTHRVVAPDLPGHGSSTVADGRLDAGRCSPGSVS